MATVGVKWINTMRMIWLKAVNMLHIDSTNRHAVNFKKNTTVYQQWQKKFEPFPHIHKKICTRFRGNFIKTTDRPTAQQIKEFKL